MGYGYIVTAGKDYHNSWILNCSRTRIPPIRMLDMGADVAMSENPVKFEMNNDTLNNREIAKETYLFLDNIFYKT